ncbi:unnamed protein product [Closterium sp. NIES-65]|nr:unnamed protein product [Closterium sp. NIES-65]
MISAKTPPPAERVAGAASCSAGRRAAAWDAAASAEVRVRAPATHGSSARLGRARARPFHNGCFCQDLGGAARTPRHARAIIAGSAAPAGSRGPAPQPFPSRPHSARVAAGGGLHAASAGGAEEAAAEREVAWARGEEGVWSVVIPTYNRLPILTQCLRALEQQRGERQAGVRRYEVVVVDDGSDDGTVRALAAMGVASCEGLAQGAGEGGAGEAVDGETRQAAVAFPHVRLVQQQHGGATAARNYGVRVAGGSTIVFIDSDMVVCPGALPARCRADAGAHEQGRDGGRGGELVGSRGGGVDAGKRERLVDEWDGGGEMEGRWRGGRGETEAVGDGDGERDEPLMERGWEWWGGRDKRKGKGGRGEGTWGGGGKNGDEMGGAGVRCERVGVEGERMRGVEDGEEGGGRGVEEVGESGGERGREESGGGTRVSFLAAHARALAEARSRFGDERTFSYGRVVNTSNFHDPMAEPFKLTDYSAAFFATGNVAIARHMLAAATLRLTPPAATARSSSSSCTSREVLTAVEGQAGGAVVVGQARREEGRGAEEKGVEQQWQEMGPFDVDFSSYGWEDLELGGALLPALPPSHHWERLRQCGARIWQCPEAVGFHWHPPFHPSHLPALIRQERQRGENGVRFFLKHRTLNVRLMVQMTPFHAALWFLLTLGGALNERSLAPLLAWLVQQGHPGVAVGILSPVLNWHTVQATREEVHRLRKAGVDV